MGKARIFEGPTAEAAKEQGLPLPWMIPFLAELNQTGNVRLACEAAGISRGYVQRAKLRYKRFAAAWSEAIDNSLDLLEAAATERALESSDTLLKFLLTSRRPEVYGETVRHRHEGELGLHLVEEVIGTDAGVSDPADE